MKRYCLFLITLAFLSSGTAFATVWTDPDDPDTAVKETDCSYGCDMLDVPCEDGYVSSSPGETNIKVDYYWNEKPKNDSGLCPCDKNEYRCKKKKKDGTTDLFQSDTTEPSEEDFE